MSVQPISSINSISSPILRDFFLGIRREYLNEGWTRILDECNFNHAEATRRYNLWVAKEEAEWFEEDRKYDSQTRRWEAFKRRRKRKPYCKA